MCACAYTISPGLVRIFIFLANCVVIFNYITFVKDNQEIRFITNLGNFFYHFENGEYHGNGSNFHENLTLSLLH